MTEVGATALQNQRLGLVAIAEAYAALTLPVQSVGCQVNFQIEFGCAHTVQVAAAVSEPLERGQVAELARLRGAAGFEMLTQSFEQYGLTAAHQI